MQQIGQQMKVLPTAVVAAAMGPSTPERELADRIDVMLDGLRAKGANLAVHSGAEAIAAAAEPLEYRGIIAREDGVFRVRDRTVLKYYARSIDHLLPPRPEL